jgi:hypothetical protein
MTEPRRIALLVELPATLGNAQLPALRLLLKSLIRNYGIKCLSVLPPSETRTFGCMAGGSTKSEPVASDGDQAAATKPEHEDAVNAKPDGLVKPKKRKRGNTLNGSKPT